MQQSQGAPSDWLLVSISTGAEASLRVAVWRQLRKLGAVYLHSSVCLLPNLPPVSGAVQALVARVTTGGGRARALGISFPDPDELAEVIALQQADRDVEYTEVLERLPTLMDEIRTETARGRATYAEVEESEVDLERFDRWMASIQARDYFHAPKGQEAQALLETCRQALKTFESAALAADTIDSPPPALGPGGDSGVA